MTIFVYPDGNVQWKFRRKSYKKARWRRLGQRMLDDFQSTPGASGIILVIWNR